MTFPAIGRTVEPWTDEPVTRCSSLGECFPTAAKAGHLPFEQGEVETADPGRFTDAPDLRHTRPLPFIHQMSRSLDMAQPRRVGQLPVRDQAEAAGQVVGRRPTRWIRPSVSFTERNSVVAQPPRPARLPLCSEHRRSPGGGRWPGRACQAPTRALARTLRSLLIGACSMIDRTSAPFFAEEAPRPPARAGPEPATTTDFPAIGRPDFTRACKPPAPRTLGKVQPGKGKNSSRAPVARIKER